MITGRICADPLIGEALGQVPEQAAQPLPLQEEGQARVGGGVGSKGGAGGVRRAGCNDTSWTEAGQGLAGPG
ncbi:hypothetical protein HaLaN_17866, partial [Haematococcus lacustris]